MNIYLILHNIRSLHNVGSIFRTADAIGVKKIYLTGYTPSPYDLFGKLRRDFAKTALGAERHILWNHKKNTASLLRENIFIVSLEQTKRAIPYNRLVSLYRSTLKRHLSIALVVGNEVKGISRSILKKSDAIIQIPMYGKKESLNVSVATGIALYSIREQLRLK